MSNDSATWVHEVGRPEWCSRSFIFNVHDNVIKLSIPVSEKLFTLCIEIRDDSLRTYSSKDVEKLIKESMETALSIKGAGVDVYLKTLFSTLMSYYHRELALIDQYVEKVIDSIIEGKGELVRLYRVYNRAARLHRAVHGLIYGLHRLGRLYEGLESLVSDALTLESMYGTTIDRITNAFSLHYTVVGERTNSVVTKLTVISAIFLPLTLIAGIYGMNFKYMPELNHPLAYPLVLMLMASIALGELIYFKRKKWI